MAFSDRSRRISAQETPYLIGNKETAKDACVQQSSATITQVMHNRRYTVYPVVRSFCYYRHNHNGSVLKNGNRSILKFTREVPGRLGNGVLHCILRRHDVKHVVPLLWGPPTSPTTSPSPSVLTARRISCLKAESSEVCRFFLVKDVPFHKLKQTEARNTSVRLCTARTPRRALSSFHQEISEAGDYYDESKLPLDNWPRSFGSCRVGVIELRKRYVPMQNFRVNMQEPRRCSKQSSAGQVRSGQRCW